MNSTYIEKLVSVNLDYEFYINCLFHTYLVYF